MAPAAERAAGGGGLVATESHWGGALSLFSDIPRERIVPAGVVGGAIDPAEVRAYLVIPRLQRKRTGEVGEIDEDPPVARSLLWRLYVPD
jgi:hypothetical protein